uniref:Uncharacterized protein n=1 Tax=Salix viminalis TaxID=40686 RepID=A0A6N2N1X0_SALVM
MWMPYLNKILVITPAICTSGINIWTSMIPSRFLRLDTCNMSNMPNKLKILLASCYEKVEMPHCTL